MANPINTPETAGLYWARTRRSEWWNLIIYVDGETPFLYVNAVWKWADDSLILNKHSLFDIQEFGPKIQSPPQPVLSKEEKNV